MQEFDPSHVQKLRICLKEREQFDNLFKDIDLNLKTPVLMKIMEESIDENGSIEKPLR